MVYLSPHPYHYQAGIIGHKKEAAAETLRGSREEFNRISTDLEQKQEMVNNAEGNQQVLKGEDVSIEWQAELAIFV